MQNNEKKQTRGICAAIRDLYRAFISQDLPKGSYNLDGGVKGDETACIQQALSKAADCDEEEVDKRISLARLSFDEVKKLTEHHDDKATKSLTVVTFISAFLGLLMNWIVKDYPAERFRHIGLNNLNADMLFISIMYISFALYALGTAAGALIIFHAIRVRFFVPDTWLPENEANNKIGSYFFYQQIDSVHPEKWANAYATKAVIDIKREHLKNYIHESYLLVKKVTNKIKFLESGQYFLFLSSKMLFIFLIALVLTVLFVEPTRTPPLVNPIADTSVALQAVNPAVAAHTEAPADEKKMKASPTMPHP